MADKLIPFRDAKREFERRYCEAVLHAAGGCVSVAARLADKDRRSFYELMDRTGVRPRGSAPAKSGPRVKKRSA